MDSATVSRAFTFVEGRFSGTPCWECKGRETIGTIYQGIVIASCEGCGGATRIGPLARLWDPSATRRDVRRPVVRAPQKTVTPSGTVRRQPR
ncbi:hypothetical protein [Streptomyces sp. NPDC126514]|uniref:hypothetical protein n=1 Tax=Streptomyces sp. NPDC126514 TaxID=3155210 RepID=UPI003326FCDD